MASADAPSITPDAEALLPKVEEAVRTIVCNKEYWQKTLAVAVNSAAALVVSLSEADKQALDAYHAPLSFSAEGQPAQKAPNLRLTRKGAAVDDIPASSEGSVRAAVCRQTSDLRMCDACLKVAARMHACKGCHHAWFCSPACQRAAWKAGHKDICRSVPDRPQVCRFWLASFVSALDHVAPLDVGLALGPLCAFIWRFTFAAIPKPLRADLLATLYRVRERAHEGTRQISVQVLAGVPPLRLNAAALCKAVKDVSAVLQTIERDEAYLNWKRTPEGRAVAVPEDPANGCSWLSVHVREEAGASIASALADQDAFGVRRDANSALDPRTARLAVASVPRGIGLISSAFGLHVAHKTHAALLTRLTLLYEALPGSFREFECELVHACCLGWLDPARTYAPPTSPPARSDPRHLVLTSPRQLQHNGVLQMHRADVAASLVEVRRLGACAVPLSVAELQGSSMQVSSLAHRMAASPEAARAAVALLASRDAVYTRASWYDSSAAWTAPDLQL